MNQSYKIADRIFTSRLILGTGKYSTLDIMKAAHEASGTQMVTVAIRRIDLKAPPEENLLEYIDKEKIALLPNTAACFTAEEAIQTARLARQALNTNWIKLEVIGDKKTLFPDVPATLEAAKVLLDEGFVVLPYITDDPVACLKLAELGCQAVMPLAAPIGSGLGVRNPYNLKIILEQSKVPVIVDAGVGCASDAAIAMELGCTALLMNTAVAEAQDPVKMAVAMKQAVEAGRLSYEAGRIPKKLYANASSPLEGVIGR
ncbi:MAG: thiazole synthase [bacterium]|nr:thiazole synthase [bacterium]